MKKICTLLVLSFICFGSGLRAQELDYYEYSADEMIGAVHFCNYYSSDPYPFFGVDAPFYEADGVTKLAGNNYKAQLYILLGNRFCALEQPRNFGTGAEAGYIMGTKVLMPYHQSGKSWPILLFAIWDVRYGETFGLAATNGHAATVAPFEMTRLVSGKYSEPAEPARPIYSISLGNSASDFNQRRLTVKRLEDQSTMLIWGNTYPLHWRVLYKTNAYDPEWSYLATGQSTNRLACIYTDTTADTQTRYYKIEYFMPEED